MTKANHSLEKYEQFRFDAGALSLNLVATVRHRGSTPRDLLDSPAAVDRWLQLAGLPTNDTHTTVDDYNDLLHLREAIHLLGIALIEQQLPPERAVHDLNRWAAHPTAAPQLEHAYTLQWSAEYPIRACITAVARDAVLLFGITERERFKLCTHADCQMLFVDLSAKNQRRWCSMSICGNREKVAAHRQRKQSDAASEEHS